MIYTKVNLNNNEIVSGVITDLLDEEGELTNDIYLAVRAIVKVLEGDYKDMFAVINFDIEDYEQVTYN